MSGQLWFDRTMSEVIVSRCAGGMRVEVPGIPLSFVAPGEGAAVAGRQEAGRQPFDAGFRFAQHPLEVRWLWSSLAAPPVPGTMPRGPDATPERALALCTAYAMNRQAAPQPAHLGPPVHCAAWRVDGAASSVYPLRAADGDYEWEECLVLVKGRPAACVYLTKVFSSARGMTPPLWADLNGRLNASLAWGATREAPSIASAYLDADSRLLPAARARAANLAIVLLLGGVTAEDVESVAAKLRRMRGSDAPDAPWDRQLLPLLPLTAFAAAPQALSTALVDEIGAQVKVMADYFALPQFCDAIAAAMRSAPPRFSFAVGR